MAENTIQLNTEMSASRAYCRLPKALFADECLRTMSLAAKVLYAFLLDRRSLSIARGWCDEYGRPYIIFSHETVMQTLRISSNPATACMNELIECGLVERRHQGFGRPAWLYVRDILSESQNQGDENLTIRESDAHNLSPIVSESETVVSQNVSPSKTERSKTERNKTKRSNQFTRGLVRRDDHQTVEEDLAEIYAEQGIEYPITRPLTVGEQEASHDT